MPGNQPPGQWGLMMTNTEATKRIQARIRRAQKELAMTRDASRRAQLVAYIKALNSALYDVSRIDSVDMAELGY